MPHCRRETNGVFVVILYITKIWVGSRATVGAAAFSPLYDFALSTDLVKVSSAKYIGHNKILVSKCFSQSAKQHVVQPIYI
jgi:hypothetical protein